MPEPTDFAEFYSASFDSLCVQLHAHTGSWAEAQDVAQEAFLPGAGATACDFSYRKSLGNWRMIPELSRSAISRMWAWICS